MTGADHSDARAERIEIVGLEEHVALPSLQDAWSKVPGIELDMSLGFGHSATARKLRDAGRGRLADMDEQGVDVQVLSAPSPGVQNLPADVVVDTATAFNDELAAAVRSAPGRFEAFATLPLQNSDAACAELERTVARLGFRGAMLYGRTGEARLDDRQFDGLYATAERLGVPLYLHPQLIPSGVAEAYYSGFGTEFDKLFAGPGLGWYFDLGVQLLRLIFAGTFDRHPKLQVIVGHWGEVVLFFLDHWQFLQHATKLDREPADYLRENIWITGSGTLSERYLRWSADVVGTDRLLYATDYPYTFGTSDTVVETSKGRAREFLERAPLVDSARRAIGADNWRRLVGMAQTGAD